MTEHGDNIKADKALVAYGFLATLNNLGKDLLTNVYIPLFKRAISSYSLLHDGGKDSDLQEHLLSMYDLKIPIYTIRSLLKHMEKDFSRKEKKDYSFGVFEKGKIFSISKYAFSDYEEHYQDEVRKSNALEAAFSEFLSTINDSTIDRSPLSNFINHNKLMLSVFFNKSNSKIPATLKNDTHYLAHVNFLKEIEANNPTLFQSAEKVYLGSVIAAVLESQVDLNTKFNSKNTYFLDTQFVLRALDLQNVDETQAAEELIKLLFESGQEIRVTNITLDEITSNIQNTIDNFSTNPLVLMIKNPTINHACIRNNISKTDLQNLQDSIETLLSDKLHAKVDKIPKKIIEEATKSKDHTELKASRQREANALHDVASYFFVRNLRGGCLHAHQKAQHWFISSNSSLYFFNKNRVAAGCIPEVITPDELTSLLWLKDPNALGKNISRIGLNVIIAQTIQENLPSYSLLSELDANIHKYSSVTPKQYELISSNLSKQSTAVLQNLVNLSHSNSAEFTTQILEIAKIEDGARQNISSNLINAQQKIDSLNLNNNQLSTVRGDLENRLKAIENSLESSNKKNEHVLAEKEKTIHENEVLKRKLQIQSKLIVLISIVFLCAILFIILWNVLGSTLIKTVILGIPSLGGLWGFFSFLINLSKLTKNR